MRCTKCLAVEINFGEDATCSVGKSGKGTTLRGIEKPIHNKARKTKIKSKQNQKNPNKMLKKGERRILPAITFAVST
jgi:hypothetical protein